MARAQGARAQMPVIEAVMVAKLNEQMERPNG